MPGKIDKANIADFIKQLMHGKKLLEQKTGKKLQERADEDRTKPEDKKETIFPLYDLEF